MENKYTPQGYASPAAILITTAIGLLASLILPLLYIVLSRLIPNIWFIAIIAFLLGLGLGFFIDLGIKIGKIRNKRVAIIIAVLCGIFAFYVQWVFFDTIVYSNKGFTFNLGSADFKILLSDFFFLFTHPNVLFQEIVNLNAIGTFRIESTDTISGLLLWIIWVGEFIVILGGIIFAVLNGQVTKPYSELNDQWMKRRKVLNRIPLIENKELILSELSNRNFAVLNDNPSLINEQNYAEVIVFESAGDQTKYVSIINVTNPTGKAKDKKVKNVLTFYPLQNANI
ncbi:hypothetical protein ACFOG5_13975 [Pedobacter fastidiosus]|uniref:Uncharacterized protein n=1 Tax=Pedobacter fastidiosus TaxID=2765361 RepID=A0ABR7KM73_9SPHI|nr:hypothetical protein [Pedobacter fastidiosus]MBC6108862.1 hypothetical protein [Pedobacter fastidiosus]